MGIRSQLGELGPNILELGRAAGAVGGAGFAGRLGSTVQGGLIGASAGAGWGMLSGDTSVLGGMTMGGIGGAGAGRYGRSAVKGYNRTGMAGVGRGLGRRAKADGAIFGRKYQSIKSTLKGWGATAAEMRADYNKLEGN